MTKNLEFMQFQGLLRSVFALKEREEALTIFVDLPTAKVSDNPEWADRRRIAAEWYTTLSGNLEKLPFSAVLLCMYENVGTHNNDLPKRLTIASALPEASLWASLKDADLEEVLRASSVVLAPTELSATAPLKNIARRIPFRGATLPGFSRQMIPALSLDYEKVNERVMEFKSRLDRASSALVLLNAEGTSYELILDLRYRTAHASGGLMREPGIVANLPSGEAYIVPYEGERSGEESRTSGLLPVQFGDDIVVYQVQGNRVVNVVSEGPAADQERLSLREEPAYGNIAELGLGVLGEWGVQAMGSILLDEKLGLHIAFGRSDHFGGVTGPSSFRSQSNVVHIDRIYVPSCQPKVRVHEVIFLYEGDEKETIIRDDRYCV